MKKLYNLSFWILAGWMIVMSGCQKGANFEVFTYPAQSPSSLSPTSGFPGTYDTIKGKNFGDLPNAVKVYFGGIIADSVISCVDSQIVVKVPTAAVSGKVSMSIWTTTKDSIGTYTVIPLPTITTVVSLGSLGGIIAMPGDTVAIRGTHFLTDPTKVKISFNGTSATNIPVLKDTLIKVIAPSGYSAGAITITFNGLTLKGTSLSPTLPIGDISSYYLKNYIQPFTDNNISSAQKGTAGSWGTPDYWTVNSAAQNMINTGATVRCGGVNFGSTTSGQLILQAGWGDATSNTLNNGKMYQTITLPAGTYSFVITVSAYSFTSTSFVYLAVAAGSTLPDVTSVPTQSLAYTNFTNKTLTFTLAQSETVSIGFVTTMTPNSYFRVNSVQLNLLQ